MKKAPNRTRAQDIIFEEAGDSGQAPGGCGTQIRLRDPSIRSVGIFGWRGDDFRKGTCSQARELKPFMSCWSPEFLRRAG